MLKLIEQGAEASAQKSAHSAKILSVKDLVYRPLRTLHSLEIAKKSFVRKVLYVEQD